MSLHPLSDVRPLAHRKRQMFVHVCRLPIRLKGSIEMLRQEQSFRAGSYFIVGVPTFRTIGVDLSRLGNQDMH